MHRGPRDDTAEYTDRTRRQARLEQDYLRGDIRGTLGVIAAAIIVVAIGVLLMWLVL
jgi:hypothetical protein